MPKLRRASNTHLTNLVKSIRYGYEVEFSKKSDHDIWEHGLD
jgi:hypothetical protein